MSLKNGGRGQWLVFSREEEKSISEKLPRRLYQGQNNKLKKVVFFIHMSRTMYYLSKAEKPLQKCNNKA